MNASPESISLYQLEEFSSGAADIKTISSCAHLCDSHSECFSFEFSATSRICNRHTGLTQPANLQFEAVRDTLFCRRVDRTTSLQVWSALRELHSLKPWGKQMISLKRSTHKTTVRFCALKSLSLLGRLECQLSACRVSTGSSSRTRSHPLTLRLLLIMLHISVSSSRILILSHSHPLRWAQGSAPQQVEVQVDGTKPHSCTSTCAGPPSNCADLVAMTSAGATAFRSDLSPLCSSFVTH